MTAKAWASLLVFFFFEYLKSFNIDRLKELKTVSKDRAKLPFTSALRANDLIKNNVFKKKNLKVYIPRSFTERCWIIRNVPIEHDVNENIKNAVCNIPIKSAVRLRRRNRDNNDDFIPATSIEIGFKGKALHKSIKFNFCNLPVNYFVPALKHCFKCTRYGHVSKFCKAQKTSWHNCGKSPKCSENSETVCTVIQVNTIFWTSLVRRDREFSY